MPLPPAPILLLGQGYKGRDRLIPVGRSRVAVGGEPPGMLLNWGQVHNDGVIADASNAAPLEPVLASPGAVGYNRATIGGHKAAANWIQRRAPHTATEWDQTVDEAIAAQESLGVPGIILPSRQLGPADWPDGVQDTS